MIRKNNHEPRVKIKNPRSKPLIPYRIIILPINTSRSVSQKLIKTFVNIHQLYNKKTPEATIYKKGKIKIKLIRSQDT